MKIPDNSLQSFLQFFRASLKDNFTENELEANLHEVFLYLFGLKRSDLILSRQKSFSESDILRIFKVVKELKKGRPLAYVLSHKNFYGLDLYVNENVLIPRPETEELVQWVIVDCETIGKIPSIIDVGTGSGCIALALKKNLANAKITAVDISAEALAVAKHNAIEHNLEIEFRIMDILTDEFDASYDIVVSNPPYISLSEKDLMEQNVLEYEPQIALFAYNDPLIFYKRMMELALKQLPEESCFYWEINQYLWQDLQALLEGYGFRDIMVKKDINDNYRMIRFLNKKKS